MMCQEIGHDFGLDHQDESGADLNTCMDYSDALDNPSPNNHDYQQLQVDLRSPRWDDHDRELGGGAARESGAALGSGDAAIARGLCRQA